jgi:hypothetical protein
MTWTRFGYQAADGGDFLSRLGDHDLMLPPKQLLDGTVPAGVTAVAVSQCGNFGFVATSSGRLDRYNMQSGIHRGQICYVSSDVPCASIAFYTAADE